MLMDLLIVSLFAAATTGMGFYLWTSGGDISDQWNKSWSWFRSWQTSKEELDESFRPVAMLLFFVGGFLWLLVAAVACAAVVKSVLGP
jgi:hypothetical protein